MSLKEFNHLDDAAAHGALELCCTSERWIAGVAKGRPYASGTALREAADKVWASLDREDILQAFEGHPKIGDVDSLQARYASSGHLAASEQAGMARADDDTILRLARGNTRYEERFGYIFIVCASGKSATEMCALLEARLNNSRDKELRVAAEEQRKILQLRLEKLL